MPSSESDLKGSGTQPLPRYSYWREDLFANLLKSLLFSSRSAVLQRKQLHPKFSSTPFKDCLHFIYYTHARSLFSVVFSVKHRINSSRAATQISSASSLSRSSRTELFNISFPSSNVWLPCTLWWRRSNLFYFENFFLNQRVVVIRSETASSTAKLWFNKHYTNISAKHMAFVHKSLLFYSLGKSEQSLLSKWLY